MYPAEHWPIAAEAVDGTTTMAAERNTAPAIADIFRFTPSPKLSL